MCSLPWSVFASVSSTPDPDGDLDDQAFDRRLGALHRRPLQTEEIAAKESGLLFVDDLGIQARLTGLIEVATASNADPMALWVVLDIRQAAWTASKQRRTAST